MPTQIIKDLESKMNNSITSFKKELNKIRTGRANPAILDGILVEYYGAMTPLNQIATLQVPEAQIITVKPFDRTSLDQISKAIMSSNIGLTPNNDGEIIRLNIPSLTKERRKELTKDVRKIAENSKISIRNIRRDGIDKIKKIDGVSEDDIKGYSDDVQNLTNKFVDLIDEIAKEKEKEVESI